MVNLDWNPVVNLTVFSTEDNSEYDKIHPIPRDSYGRKYPRGFVDERYPKYRLGALYFEFKNYRFGVDSEHVRHAIQDKAIHGLINDAGFENTSWNWKSYLQYQTKTKFTLW